MSESSAKSPIGKLQANLLRGWFADKRVQNDVAKLRAGAVQRGANHT